MSLDAVVLGGERGVREAVLPQDLGGDALAQALGVLRVGQQHGVGVNVGVDEAGRYHVATGVHPLGRRRFPQQAAGSDPSDPATLHGNVAKKPCAPRTIHDPAILDDQIVIDAGIGNGWRRRLRLWDGRSEGRRRGPRTGAHKGAKKKGRKRSRATHCHLRRARGSPRRSLLG